MKSRLAEDVKWFFESGPAWPGSSWPAFVS
jgi:hypothetical protein